MELELAVRDSPLAYVNQRHSETNFLALRALFSQLQLDRKYTILDMGPAWGSNLNFFSHFRCKLYIEDFFRYREAAMNNGDWKPERVLESLQAYPADTRFDVLLFWDLFDYLPPTEVRPLIEHLKPFCHKGTLLFFITSGMDKIPAKPATFKIIDAQHLVYKNECKETIAAYGYNQNKLSKLLQGFKISRAFRMSSGVEENLYVFDGSPTA